MNGYLFSSDLLQEVERLQSYMDRVLGTAPTAIRGGSRGSFPAVNLGSTPDTIEVLAFAPGIEPASIEVTIDKGLLTIAGERKGVIPEGEKVTVYAHERFEGPFRRVISLPEDADPARVDAKYTDGFLRVSVSKRESSKPRRIDIQ